MKELIVKVNGKRATYAASQGPIICDNSDYQVKFEFDSSWDGVAGKEACFVFGDCWYKTAIDTDGACAVPPLEDVSELKVGVYVDGVAATTSAKIPCAPSVLSEKAKAKTEYEPPVPAVKYSEGLAFSLNDDGASYAVSGIGDCVDADIVIPPTHNGLPVKGIEGMAFNMPMGINSITVPDSVEAIGSHAFGESSNVTIYLGSGVKSISESAFGMSYQLEIHCAFDMDAVNGAPWGTSGSTFYFNGEKHPYTLGLMFEYDEVNKQYILTSTGFDYDSYTKIPPTYNGCQVCIGPEVINEGGVSTFFLPRGLGYISSNAFSRFTDITINCEFTDNDALASGAPWGATNDVEGVTVNYNVTL